MIVGLTTVSLEIQADPPNLFDSESFFESKY